ncbi:type IV secretory system conjugative DNA transfer family protein [Natronococcus amylolyticus]|uniref:type IV secretory system conjugative DNA transfer family protein n=1 Tax=Natronococcus amylolyticus TaxID=44470 RepID=UPI0009FC5021|nr:TraM recognition domain-containing protein [Natronococcus amylolyticus]
MTAVLSEIRRCPHNMTLPFGDDGEPVEEMEKFGARIEGEDDPSEPVLINNKEWAIQRYDPVEEEIETYAGAWPRAMIENAQAVPRQPLWIGVSESSGREVPVEFDRLFRHVFYGGSTGTGKTTKMYNDAVALMYGGHGVTIIDPKGDDIYDLLRRVPEDRWDDVIYIAPGDDFLDKSVGFNLFETYHEPDETGFDEEIEGIVDDFKELLKAGDFWGNRMDRVMKTMVRGMIRHEFEFTPLELYYALLDEENRREYADLIASADDDDIAFLEVYTRQIAEELTEQELDALVGRLKDWVENPITRQILAQRESDVSIAEAVNEGKIIICKNDLPGEAKRMVATAVMRRVWTCVNDRINPSEKKVRELAGANTSGGDYDPYFLMIDECDDVLTEASQIDKMLTKARSKKLGLLLATQTLHQLDAEAQQAILSNCNTLVSLNPLLPDEARALSDRFGGKDPRDLTQIPDYHAQTKLRHEDDSFMAKLTPPYPPLHSIEEAFDLIQQSTERYGIERQSGREVLDGLFFAGTGQSDAATAAGRENTSSSVEEPMDVDDVEAAQAALKAIYDETIRAESTSVETPAAEQAVTDATGLEYTQASNIVERLEAAGALEQRSTSDGLEITVTPEGRGQIGLETGSGGSGGKSKHRHMLREVYEWGTRSGYEMKLPTQDGDELPDAVGEVPPSIVPDGDLSEDERDQIVQSRLESEYPEILELSGTETLYIEAESKGLSKPGGPIKNAAKAPSPEQLLFVVGDGGDDGLTRNAERLASIFGADGSDPFTSIRTPTGAARKFYTRGKLEMARDDSGTEKLAIVPEDVSTEWIELQSGAIVCRDRDTDETYLRFDSPKEYRERDPTDAPATVHYDPEDTTYVVERSGDVERKYGGKGPLTDDWTHIYEPVIPEAIFREHGHESVPEPEEFRIAIVPNDDRDLEGEPELLLFDVGSEAAIPIGTWLDESTNGVTTESAEPESESEIAVGTEPESADEPTTDGDNSDAESTDRDAVPLREPEEPVPAPETPEQRPDPECEPEAEDDSGQEKEEEESTTDNSFNSI